jgi:putative PIN family toxin of toxin-antitoxin system
MRAVVDTNILVSGLLRPDGPPGAVVRQIVAQAIEPVVCDAVVAEYRAVLPRRRLRLRAADIAELLALIEAQALWVEIPPYDGQPALPDPADWPFIACALAAGCPVITGNARDFPAGLGVRVMAARELMGQSHE